MGKEYLKMADVFSGPLYPYDDRRFLADDCGYCGEFDEDERSQYAAHAINSHDELVEQRDELLMALELVIEWIDTAPDLWIDIPERGGIDAAAIRMAISKAKGC